MYPDYLHGDNDNDEHITGLITKSPVKQVSSPIYISKYRKSVEEEAARDKYDHKTLGLMRVLLNKPDQFLRKNSGIHPKRPEVKHMHYRRPDYQHKLPTWEPLRLSKTSDKPLEKSNKAPNSEKNFKKENILNIKKSQAQTSASHQPSRSQHSFNLPKSAGPISISGNRQRHTIETGAPVTQGSKVKRPSDKKVRARYLDRPNRTSTISKDTGGEKSTNIDKWNDAKSRRHSAPQVESVAAKFKRNTKESKGHYVTEEERSELLYGMKKKWDEMMRQFQALPFLADTPPKAKRKSLMEEKLKQLEKDIDEIERHPHIYVYDDDDDNDGNNIKKS